MRTLEELATVMVRDMTAEEKDKLAIVACAKLEAAFLQAARDLNILWRIHA